MTSGDKIKGGSAVLAMGVGWLAFLYFMQEILREHTDWASLRTPAAVGEILGAVTSSTVAFFGAWFGDRGKILSMLKGLIPT